jgi:hypothetical protein
MRPNDGPQEESYPSRRNNDGFDPEQYPKLLDRHQAQNALHNPVEEEAEESSGVNASVFRQMVGEVDE